MDREIQQKLRAETFKLLGGVHNYRRFLKAASEPTGISEIRLLSFLDGLSGLPANDARRLAKAVGVDPRTGMLNGSETPLRREMRRYGFVSDEYPPVEDDTASKPLPDILRTIPEQSEVLKFVPKDGKQLVLAPSPLTDDDVAAITVYQKELLETLGQLSERYATSQSPQADLFRPVLDRYRAELSKPAAMIDFMVLYMRGSRIYSRKAIADENIAADDPEWIGANFDADEQDEIETICDVHGLMMMQSPVGRKAVTDAARFRATADEADEQNRAFRALAVAVKSKPGLFDDRSEEIIGILEEDDLGDRQPERSRGLKILVSGSLLTLFVGIPAAAGAVVGAMTSPLVSVLLGTGATRVSYEVVKDTEAVKAAKQAGTDGFNRADRAAGENVARYYDELVVNLREVRDQYADAFERISNLVPEFGWAKRFTVMARAPDDRFSKVNFEGGSVTYVDPPEDEVWSDEAKIDRDRYSEFMAYFIELTATEIQVLKMIFQEIKLNEICKYLAIDANVYNMIVMNIRGILSDFSLKEIFNFGARHFEMYDLKFDENRTFLVDYFE